MSYLLGNGRSNKKERGLYAKQKEVIKLKLKEEHQKGGEGLLSRS